MCKVSFTMISSNTVFFYYFYSEIYTEEHGCRKTAAFTFDSSVPRCVVPSHMASSISFVGNHLVRDWILRR